MDSQKLEIIKNLMEQLIDEMDYGKEDFESRLGRKKPDVEVMKIGVEGPGLEKAEEKLGMDLDGDEEMGESPRHKAKVMGGDYMSEDCDDEDMEMDPDDSLKQRLMRLRG